MSSTAESSPLSQSSVGSKARVVSRRGQIGQLHRGDRCYGLYNREASEQRAATSEFRRSDITSRPRTKKEKIQQALTSALAIPGYAISMFVHPLMRGLFTELNPNVELPRSFDTLKCMLVSEISQSSLGDLRVRTSITDT
uniref:Uncharacterized protein n=1 Tax=Ditylenchus dipsaci TaxID=166011 RepID=A0A915D0V1_9BILA